MSSAFQNHIFLMSKVACEELTGSVLKSPMDKLFTQTGKMLYTVYCPLLIKKYDTHDHCKCLVDDSSELKAFFISRRVKSIQKKERCVEF